MATPARWRNGSSGWTASRRTPDRDPAGAGRQPEGAAGQESKPEQQEAEGEASRGAASGDVSGGWRPRPVAPSGTSKQNQYFDKCFISISLKFY